MKASKSTLPTAFLLPKQSWRPKLVLELLAEIVEIYNNYNWQTEVLAASICHPIHVVEAARMGAHVATMPFKVIGQLLKHPSPIKALTSSSQIGRIDKHCCLKQYFRCRCADS
jgi:transaldolase